MKVFLCLRIPPPALELGEVVGVLNSFSSSSSSIVLLTLNFCSNAAFISIPPDLVAFLFFFEVGLFNLSFWSLMLFIKLENALFVLVFNFLLELEVLVFLYCGGGGGGGAIIVVVGGGGGGLGGGVSSNDELFTFTNFPFSNLHNI